MAHRRLSTSLENGSDEVQSPKKLVRSVWNQVAPTGTPASGASLQLRRLHLSPALPVLAGALQQCAPHAAHIVSLDLSYSILEEGTVVALCSELKALEAFIAVNCSLAGLMPDIPWPRRLRVLDLSRNDLTEFPPGVDALLHLEKLNLSGNRITSVDPAILRLPKLKQLYLLKNPIENIPKAICRGGIGQMREYFNVELLPMPDPEASCNATKRRRISSSRQGNLSRLLRKTESTESGYDSGARLFSTSSSGSLNTNDFDPDPDPWPKFHPSRLPQGYTDACSEGQLCHIYLPEGCRDRVSVEIVKDLSLHPPVRPNELLITPVVRITPHGLTFANDTPAIVVLSHCTGPSACHQRLVPLCSSTDLCQPPRWTRVTESQTSGPRAAGCEIFQDCVMFPTTHFSLFAVLSVMPYPTAITQIEPSLGGILSIPDLPGFQVSIPPDSMDLPTSVQATVYYADRPYHNHQDSPFALASACFGLEPHGMEFRKPIKITIPIPDFNSIQTAFNDSASLQLWHSPFIPEDAFHWEPIENAPISIHGQTATFSVTHFSFFKLLWALCRDTLQRLGYGASLVYSQLSSRTRYVSVRCQVFMSVPLPDMTFGLLVMVYKFGDPLKELSNYKWPLADTGDKHVFLRTGEISLTLSGHFEPRGEFGETSLSRCAVIDFTGEDFCLRFEFALRLRELQLPLLDHQVIGKLCVGHNDGVTPIELNLIKPAMGTSQSAPPHTPPSVLQQTPAYMEFTPPWSPENDPIPHFDSQDGTVTFAPGNELRTDTAFPSPPRPTKRKQNSPTSAGHVRAKRRLLVREGQITDKFLMEVAHSVGSKWEELGIALDLDFGTIRSVVGGTADSNRPEHMRAFYVLQEWRRRAADGFTFARLALALEEAGLNSSAQQLCYSSESPCTMAVTMNED